MKTNAPLLVGLTLFLACADGALAKTDDRPAAISETGRIVYKVAILGCPSEPNVEWNAANLTKIKQLGFNTLQLNIAWGARPADEPLNLEDVVDLPPGLCEKFPQVVPLRSQQTPERIQQRRADLRQRIKLCREAGLRSIFHFGAPFNAHCTYGSAPPNCLLMPETTERYVALLEAFAAEYPGVDDILVYTYDQDAWLCSEFGSCPRCKGVPLHERVVPFVQKLTDAWHKINPNGRLWWEPWELSAGQVLKSVEKLNAKGFGLALHCNVAEVISTMSVDRWLRNVCNLASHRNIPVIVEYFLGAPSEEVEPYRHLAWPLVTLRGLQTIASVPGVVGIKEYYGLLPNKEDPNLRMAAQFFADPQVNEQQALRNLAQPYAGAADEIAHFWALTSAGMELFPWDVSWYIREIGKCQPDHSMSAAFIRGFCNLTPVWCSTRRAIFMKTDDLEPSPWLLEDVQLRCELTADRFGQALELGQKIRDKIPSSLLREFDEGLKELTGFRQRSLSYVYHIRETNLTRVMRDCRAKGEAIPSRLTQELIAVLKADQVNQQRAEPIAAMLALLEKDADAFLKQYFTVMANKTSKGRFSVTSR